MPKEQEWSKQPRHWDYRSISDGWWLKNLIAKRLKNQALWASLNNVGLCSMGIIYDKIDKQNWFFYSRLNVVWELKHLTYYKQVFNKDLRKQRLNLIIEHQNYFKGIQVKNNHTSCEQQKRTWHPLNNMCFSTMFQRTTICLALRPQQYRGLVPMELTFDWGSGVEGKREKQKINMNNKLYKNNLTAWFI